MNTTQKFNLIHIDGFMYGVIPLIKKETFPYIVVEKLTTGEYSLWQVDNVHDWDEKNQQSILFSNDPKLNLPLLPEIEEDIKYIHSLAFDEAIIQNRHNGISVLDLIPMYIKGYKAKSAKQFTERDLIEAIDIALIVGRGGSTESLETLSKNILSNFKKSKPVAVEVEIETCGHVLPDKPKEDNWYPIFSEVMAVMYQRPKMNENDYVNVINWFYE